MNAKTPRRQGKKRQGRNDSVFLLGAFPWRLGVLAFTLLFSPTAFADEKIVGYFANWSNDYAVKDIPVDRLTHINYAFATIKDGEITVRRDSEKIKPLTQLRQ